jgi:hypothetical protein
VTERLELDGGPPSDDEQAAQIQLCVLKNSNGRTGTLFAKWNGQIKRI